MLVENSIKKTCEAVETDAIKNPSDNQNSTGSIDGVVKNTPDTGSRIARSSRHHVKHPSASSTLMRQAVRKPNKRGRMIEGLSSPLAPVTRNELVKSPVMATSVDKDLLQRAKRYKTSAQISRFGATLRSAIPPISQAQAHSPQLERLQTVAKPAGSSLLERAVENATSHQQPPLSKKELKAQRGKHPRRGRFAALAVAGVMALLVLSYAVYANMPNIMVKVASARAGFSAVLPSFRPSGYSLSSVGYQSGVIALNFNNGTGSGKFTLTEHSSNWDSATLVSSIIVPTQGANYRKVNAGGQAVYLYGNDQASWVSAGIWYQVNGNGSLSAAQLIKLATTT